MATTSTIPGVEDLSDDDEQLMRLLKIMCEEIAVKNMSPEIIGKIGNLANFVITDEIGLDEKSNFEKAKPAEPDDPMFGLW